MGDAVCRKTKIGKRKKLKEEASKCKKMKSFFTKSSTGETRGEACEEGDPFISASLEETGDSTTTSGVTTTPEPLTLTSNSEKNTDNTFHRRTGTIFLGGLKLFCPNVTSPKRT